MTSFLCDSAIKFDAIDAYEAKDNFCLLHFASPIIEAVTAIANKRSIFYLWRPSASDPDDDFIIDLAVESEADFIITYNQKDFQAAEKFGIRVVTPKKFLQHVGEIS